MADVNTPTPDRKPEDLPEVAAINLRLDWKAYYLRFKEEHGRWPVAYRGRRLFPDGWMYSSSDPAGPEWPPPDDPIELRKLQQTYWTRRRLLVKRERDSLLSLIDSMRNLQSAKSVPLQQVTVNTVEDANAVTGQRRVLGTTDLKLEGLELRLTWLVDDVKECEILINQYAVPGDLDSAKPIAS